MIRRFFFLISEITIRVSSLLPDKVYLEICCKEDQTQISPGDSLHTDHGVCKLFHYQEIGKWDLQQ